MSPRFVLGRENVPCVAEVVNRSLKADCTDFSVRRGSFEPGGNAIYVPYGDVPPIRVYFLAFESETGCLSSSLTLKQGAKFVRSLRARVPIHSTVWHPPVGFNLFVFFSGKLILVLMFSTYS